jgi:hypothetical protein
MECSLRAINNAKDETVDNKNGMVTGKQPPTPGAANTAT